MHLKQLSLVNYKNFESREFEFDNKINCFVGNNGIGKTNILDAIYHLALGKSYFNPIASQNITHGKDFFLLEGSFEKNGRGEKIVCSLKKGGKRMIKRNGKVYDRLSDHIGLLPLVMISPSDRDLILEGSETRRKFMDGVISQSNPEYLRNLIRYNKVLAQRNSLLKFFALNNTFDSDTLSVYDEQLQLLGTLIFQERILFLEAFVPLFREQYQAISGGNELVNLRYQSTLQDGELLEQLRSNINRDRALQYTSVGIHKDDLRFEISDHPIKKFGSQGQQKSFLISLKFAQFQLIKKQEKTNPILLLDDIFDKLDENRVAHIITLVEDENFGQIFLSDTHPERTENVVRAIHQSYKIFKL
ncbi:DNA replication/repair protein RecF [Flavobacteriaceae bacterium D16]|nr:DNA replication/repair protein RecF [Flavobacteriaceae bacterium D16]